MQTYSHTTRGILSANLAKCAGTGAAREIAAMRDSAHPILAMIDGLLRLAEWHWGEMESRIADDAFTGPYWLEAARNVRGMFSSASPRGFDAGIVEAIFWAAMDAAGFAEEDL